MTAYLFSLQILPRAGRDAVDAAARAQPLEGIFRRAVEPGDVSNVEPRLHKAPAKVEDKGLPAAEEPFARGIEGIVNKRQHPHMPNHNS